MQANDEDIKMSGYCILPEETLQYLPKEWQEQIQEMMDDGRAVLKSVDSELSQLARLSRCFTALVALKYIQQRLTAFEFSKDINAILELDMLTTAFVVTYARLHHGGVGSGFSRKSLPKKLHKTHDQILDMRNKRFAHDDEHFSLSNALQIGFQDDRFDVKFDLKLGYYIGGAKEWHELVSWIDTMIVEKLEKLQEKLKIKTNRDWIFPCEL